MGIAARLRGRWRFGGRRLRSDSGITTLQVLIMFPVMIFAMEFVMQEALNYYGKETLLAAAQEGVNAVRFSGNPGLTPADEAAAEATATAAANSYLAKHAGKLVTGVSLVSPVMTAPNPPTAPNARISVTLKGHAISLIPFLSFSLSQQASGPAESFTFGTG